MLVSTHPGLLQNILRFAVVDHYRTDHSKQALIVAAHQHLVQAGFTSANASHNFVVRNCPALLQHHTHIESLDTKRLQAETPATNSVFVALLGGGNMSTTIANLNS